MSIWDTSIAAVSAAFSGAAAIAAYYASRDANATAREANRTAASVAQIERDRWHRELTPQLALRIDQNTLYIRLIGPAALGKLGVVLRIRDDRDRSQIPPLGANYTESARQMVIWGPFRFPSVLVRHPRRRNWLLRLVDPPPARWSTMHELHGRVTRIRSLFVHDQILVAIEPTVKPTWHVDRSAEERWREQYRDAPMRLQATCSSEGHKQWVLNCDVLRDGSWAYTEPPTGL
ncbi:hypothetical protein ABZ864_00105 [Streptomyces sp. NPDC047082]|uniref:hypothetical protein n=1 Tax=Streptomyces sp. NPDC047082 TaxID=3155259 RepID=UPI0033FE4C08